MILYLVSVIVCGAAGAWIAERAGLPRGRLAGAVIGGLFNVPGVVFLAGIWGAEWVAGQLERLK
jgi:hypothetical protein